ncbi:MAG: arginine repressor [Phycisphaerales bacterium JB052]
MTRVRRHAMLRQMLKHSPASTQESLVAGLEAQGISVTQATVSRDLAAIGAVRGPEGYRLPEHGSTPIQPNDDLRRLHGVLREHVLTIVPAASLVVIHTAPGHANFLASEIDSARPSGMLGCLAGDDTIFIATASNNAANTLSRALNKAIGGKA